MYARTQGVCVCVLWIAGGIGITPYLSFLKEVKDDYEITLVWNVRSIEHANYKEEIENLTADQRNINFILNDSATKGHFYIDSLYKSVDLKNTSIFICGPESMRESYIKQLLQKGVSLSDIHFEEFSFR